MKRKSTDKVTARIRTMRSEEERLWAQMTGDVERLEVKDRRVGPGNAERQAAPEKGQTVARKPAAISQAARDAQSTPTANSSAQQELDRRNIRRIAKGRITIDDRIDLHGMRAAEANRALNGFLRQAQADNCKIVLVITGKGQRKVAASGNWMDDRDVGVLRREVPNWLSSGELEDVVLSYRTALPQHGGEGALYVRLRRIRG